MEKRKNIKIEQEHIIAFVLLFLTSIAFYYSDVNSNIRQGINVWEALFSGRFFQYYSINLMSVKKGEMIHPANYDMIMNILMGIWQIPLYLLEKMLHGNIQQYALAKIWGSLYPMVAILFSGNILRRIALLIHMTEKQAKNAAFMFVTSTYVLTASCVVAQADSVGVLFALLAIEALLKEENGKFFLFYILAVQCKFFALFIFIPILLLKEKNVIKLALQALLPMAISFAVDLPFKMLDPVGTASKKTRLHDMLYSFAENKVTFMGVGIPVLFIVFSIICFYCYFKELPEEKGVWYLYAGGASILSVLICFRDLPYWMIYAAPFIYIFMFQKEEWIARRILIETIASFCLTAAFMINFHWIYDTGSLLISQGNPAEAGTPGPLKLLSDFLNQEKYCDLWTVFYGIFIAWAIGFLIARFPERKQKKEQGDTKAKEISLTPLLYARAAGGFVLCSLSFWIYLVWNLIH